MNDPVIIIKEDEDWSKFPSGSPELIVDPMVFRSADIYLRGRRNAEQTLPNNTPDAIWGALRANIGSLVAFFDALLLSERLPIIDYGYTFESRNGFEQQEDLYKQCNQAADEQVLVPVHVMLSAYHQAHDAALEALRERPEITAELAASILQEMSVFDYAWRPDIVGLDAMTENEDQRVLLTFLYGGLLFGAYAQTTGAGHLIQPKRSRLYLAASLAARSASYEYEQELFDELNMIVRQTEGMQEGWVEFDALPPILPYLLAKDPGSPHELLRSALALRKNSVLKEYRSWRKQLIADWRDKGKIDRSNEKTVKSIARGVLRELRELDDINSKLSLNVSWTRVGLTGEVPVGRLWGWILRQLPGRRYTKLLMRMQLAALEYHKLENHLLTVWSKN